MPLNSHKYSFVHPGQTEKWYLCICKVAVLIKQAGDSCTALKSQDAILQDPLVREDALWELWPFVAVLGCNKMEGSKISWR